MTAFLLLLSISCKEGFKNSPPPAPTISRFIAAKSTITADGETTLTAEFSSGIASVDQGVGTVLSGTPKSTGKLAVTTTFTLSVTNPGGASNKNVTVTVVQPAIQPIIQAPDSATTGDINLEASVTDQPNCTFAWTITGGTFTGGGLTATGQDVTFSAGSVGGLTLSCKARNAAGDESSAGTKTVNVVAMPAISSFIASKGTITSGNAYALTITKGTKATLGFTFTGGTGSIDNSVGAVISGGSLDVNPAAMTKYTLTVTSAVNLSVTKDITITVVDPAITPTVQTAAVSVSAGDANLTASVTPQPGCSLDWTISGGTFSGNATKATGAEVTFTAGAAGTLMLSCTATNAAGDVSTAGTKTVNVVAVPAVSVFSASKGTITVGSKASLSFSFTGGTGSIDNGVGSVNSGGSQEVEPAVTTKYTLSVTNGAQKTVTREITITVVPAAIQPIIQASDGVTTGEANLSAEVNPVQAGCTYAWTITGGTFTGGGLTASTPKVTFTAGTVGSLSLNCKAKNSVGDESSAGTKTVNVAAAPVITAFTASKGTISKGAKATLNFTFTGGTGSIDNGIGAVSSGGSREVEPAATTTYILTASNAVNKSVTKEITITVVDPVVPPTVSASAETVTTGDATLTAEVTSAQSECTFDWTITGGTFGLSATKSTGQKVTFTAGVAGTLTLSCTATNRAGDVSAAGTKTVSVVAAPAITVFTSSKVTITTGFSATLNFTFSGGTGSIDNGIGSVTSGGSREVNPVSETKYILTVTNAAKTTVTRDITIKVVEAAKQPVIVTTETITVGDSNLKAEVSSQENCTFAWTISTGTFTSSATVTSVTFNAASVGDIVLTCTVTNGAGDKSQGTKTIKAVAAPAISAFTASKGATTSGTTGNFTITQGTKATLTSTFTGGTGSIDNNVGSVTAGVPKDVNPDTTTIYTLTVTNEAGKQAKQVVTINTVFAPIIREFKASNLSIFPLGSSTLSFAFSNGVGVITPGDLSVVSGGTLVVNPSIHTKYTLTVTNSVGDSVVSTNTVNVLVGTRSLTVNITGESVVGDVLVAGPNNYSMPLSATTTLTNLGDGSYTIRAFTVSDSDPSATGLGLDLGPERLQRYPLKSLQTVDVTSSNVVSVYYPKPVLRINVPKTGSPGSTVPLDFVLVPGGKSRMGSDLDPDSERFSARSPHDVTILDAFYMAKTELTQAQWKAVMGTNPSLHQADAFPVENVSWDEIRTASTGFLDSLKTILALSSQPFSLPSESQWESVCRAGTTSAYFFGDNAADLTTYAVSQGSSQEVCATKAPNAWGLYDMAGNVWEWTEDDKHIGYASAPTDGTAWVDAPRDLERIVRGGSWNNALGCRSAYRASVRSDFKSEFIGFRLVMTVPPAP